MLFLFETMFFLKRFYFFLKTYSLRVVMCRDPMFFPKWPSFRHHVSSPCVATCRDEASPCGALPGPTIVPHVGACLRIVCHARKQPHVAPQKYF